MNTRRAFLQKIAFSGLSLPLSSLAASPWVGSLAGCGATTQDGPVLRVALMGLGSYANRVAEAMKDCKRAKLVGLISGTPGKLQEWRKKWDIPEANCYNYNNFDNLRNNPNIDAVYIITPNALHHPQTLRVAKAGKHVICEKPMALDAREAQEMVDACNQAGVKLLIGYRMHFEPNTLEVIRMRRDGELGKVLYFQGQSGFRIGNPSQWRLYRELAGGGAMMDIGIYSVNAARYFIGEEPVWVTAQEIKTDPQKFKAGVDETITFQMGFPGGAVASCLSTYNMGNLDRFFVNGDKGFADLQPASGYGPIRGRTHKGELSLPHPMHQTLQLDGMAAIIFDNQQPVVPVDGVEGLKDMKILDAIYAAVKSGDKVPVSLS